MNRKLKRYAGVIGLCLIILSGISMAFTACDNPMGMGQSVDLEPPVLKVTSIELPDGTVIPIEEKDNMLFIGPGILVGPGFVLQGEARDNVKVERIVVEEIGPNAPVINDKTPLWDNARIASPAKRGETQEWTIVLDGITKGERTIRVTAYDHVTEPGPDSVKQLTLLVDTDPPFVKDIKIERQPGITVGLLPKTTLEEMDSNLFENIDYFQNESFTLRAAIEHDFSLAGVTLNFLDESGKKLFTQGLERTSGTLYTPAWFITAEQIVAANPVYASGRHYLKVSITAQAEAGHTGQYEDATNLLYNLCWYPEADNPHIEMAVLPATAAGVYRFEKSSRIPLKVFDDDNAGEVYAAMITASDWANFMPGSDDNVKLQALVNNKNAFSQLQNNRLAAPVRNAIIPVEAGDTRGDFRLVVLARDVKSDKPGAWSQGIFTVTIVEEGIPIITVDGPIPNTSPQLANGKNFTITGNIQNLDALDKIRIAWIPDGKGWTADRANTEGETALTGNAAGTLSNGIKVWELTLPPGTDVQFGSKIYKVQDFSITLDIFTDFIYEDNIENETKLFMIYARGKAGDDVFEPLRFLPYKKPPVLVVSPKTYTPFSPNADINFIIEASSELGVQIEDNEVTLYSNKDSAALPLARTGNVWTAITSKNDNGEYGYQVTATDRLGNTAQQDLTVVITSPPVLKHITSPHNAGAVFSGRDTIIIQAFFDGTVDTVHGTPRLLLEGFTTSATRYAHYVRGEKTTTLEFEYKIQSGDYTDPNATPPPGLKVTKLQLNDGSITAIIPNMDEETGIASLNTIDTLPARKTLFVDGRAPTITNIVLAGKEGDSSYPGWYRAGAVVEAKVTVNRDIRVLGTPNLILQFTGTTTRNAGFVKTESDNKTMVFEYKVVSGDTAEPVRCNATSCFSDSDRQIITDTVGSNGNYLSLTGTPAPTGTVNVDAVPPAALNVQFAAGGDTPASKSLQITGTVDTTATGQYTTDGGLNWTSISGAYNTPYALPVINTPGSYNVYARQTDRAGNVSPAGAQQTFTISACELISVSCDNPNGVYPAGSTLTFKLIFSGKVYNAASGTSITIAGGAGANEGAAATITFPAVAQGSAASTLSATWTVPEGKNWNPVTITAITLTGVTGLDSNTAPDNPASVRTDYNSSRTGLKVLSVRPTITQINGAAPAGSGATTVLAAANNTVTLTFSHAVWPEQGKITIRPAAGWHIPPVLSNDDYYKVSGAVSGTNLTNLSNNYIKTTHGLLKSGASYTGTPDTTTKYVLNFSLNLSDTTGTVNNVRTALEAAKYLWQEIESVSASQVTGAGGTTITLNLDTLPNGRQWKIEIDAGAFRDEAGNTFAGWASSTDYRFWSAKTADPVIRINRISNNKATSTQDASAPLRTNVEYRIDCETPGAVISYNTWNRGTPGGTITTNAQARGVGFGVATVAATMPVVAIVGKTAPYIYRAYSEKTDGQHNSNITDATATELTNMMTAAGGKGSGVGDLSNVATFSTIQTIGDTSYSTARKDYIAAIAKRDTAPALTISDRSYEGAFKTVLVFRNPTTKHSTNGTNTGNMNGISFPDPLYVKVEGTNLQNGAVTVSGFPLNVNDITGNSSKYLYQNGSGNNADRVWIRWEVVCDFWQVYMVLSSPTLGTRLNTDDNQWNGRNSWQYWPEMWYRWMYRKYGNWGLLDGHMSAYNEDWQMNNTIGDYPWTSTAP